MFTAGLFFTIDLSLLVLYWSQGVCALFEIKCLVNCLQYVLYYTTTDSSMFDCTFMFNKSSRIKQLIYALIHGNVQF